MMLICASGQELQVKNGPRSAEITYAPEKDRLFNMYADEGSLFVKHIFVNLPAEGSFDINVYSSGKKTALSNSIETMPLYSYEEVYMGLQRVLHIRLHPFQASSYYEYYHIDVAFENSLKKTLSGPASNSSVNAHYSSQIRTAAHSFKPAMTQYVKITTDSTGIYRIDADDLKEAGIEPSMIDPSAMAMFTPSIGMIPADTPDMFVYSNPVEIPFTFIGNDDNYFDDDEYILFFARSVNGDSLNIYRNRDLYNNPYTVLNQYVLQLNADSRPARMYNPELLFEMGDSVIMNRVIMNYDSICPLEAGYGWVWKSFQATAETGDIEYAIRRTMPDIASPMGTVTVKLYFEATSLSALDTFQIDFVCNDEIIGSAGIGTYTNNEQFAFSFNVSNLSVNNEIKVIMRRIDDYMKTMYLDEIRIDYLSNINLQSNVHSVNAGTENIHIDYDNNFAIYYRNSNEFIGILDGGSYNIRINSPDELYVSRIIRSPVSIDYVDNTKMYSSSGADYIVITGNGMKNAVNSYKTYRESQGYTVGVYEMDDIYNAFSLGRQTPVAIKAFMYYAFDSWDIKPQYLLLLGAGSYDYREIINSKEKRNIVPLYETGFGIYVQGLLQSYVSDLTDAWYAKIIGDDDYADIITGRITALNEREARDVLRKIIDYEEKMKIFSQNRVMIIADDEYSSRASQTFNEIFFVRDAEKLTTYYQDYYHVEKIYLVDYVGDKQTYDEHWPSDPGEKRQVRFDINKKMEEGVSAVLFYGHGADYTLTHEHILLYPEDGDVFTNRHNYPVWILGTCSAGKFDSDDGSIGDGFQKLPYSGFSATIASARATSVTTNINLVQNAFTVDYLEGDFTTIGEYYNSIINDHGLNNYSIVLIGDPGMKIRERAEEIIITENDTFMFGSRDTISFTFPDSNRKQVHIAVYQPEYLKRHDYTHIPPYFYQRYDQCDGMMFSGHYNVQSDSLNIVIPFPDTLAPKEYGYYDEFEITAIYNDNGILRYGYSKSNIIIDSECDTAYVKAPLISVSSQGINISDKIRLPSSYRLDIEASDHYGVYQGNVDAYRSVININDSVIYLDNFVYDNEEDLYRAYVDFDSDVFTDSVALTVFNNRRVSSSMYFSIEHVTGLNYFRDLTLYPNPADDYTYISFLSNGGGIMTYSLISRNGGIMQKKIIPFSDGFNTFKVNTDAGYAGKIPPGIYLVSMEFRYFGRGDVIRENKKLIKAE